MLKPDSLFKSTSLLNFGKPELLNLVPIQLCCDRERHKDLKNVSDFLGDVMSIQLSENVAFWHYAHSYARGHTRNSRVPWLLQKSCHDLDLLQWFAGAPATTVSSFIRPTELTEANAPEGAPETPARASSMSTSAASKRARAICPHGGRRSRPR